MLARLPSAYRAPLPASVAAARLTGCPSRKSANRERATPRTSSEKVISAPITTPVAGVSERKADGLVVSTVQAAVTSASGTLLTASVTPEVAATNVSW